MPNIPEFVFATSSFEVDEPYASLARHFDNQFNELSDFIWKNRRFIDNEIEAEEIKLASYFPFNGDPQHDDMMNKLRRTRAVIEFDLLLHKFPNWTAQGNFLCTLSLFETACLTICKKLEDYTHNRLSTEKGSGITKLFKFMKKCGCLISNYKYHEQIEAAIKIRNCVIHANGIVDFMSVPIEVRNIISNKKYLIPQHRSRAEDDDPRIWLSNSTYGDAVNINHAYAWLYSSLFKQAVINYCIFANIAVVK